MSRASDPPSTDQLAASQHSQVPAQVRLADADRIGELEDGDLGDAGQVLKDAETRDAGQGLVVGSELAQGGIIEEGRGRHIKNPLWIITGLQVGSWDAGLAQQVPGQAHANSHSVL